MGFFYFIKENEGERIFFNGDNESLAEFVETRFLAELGHVKADHRSLPAIISAGEFLRSMSFAYACRAKKKEAADGSVWGRHSRAGPAPAAPATPHSLHSLRRFLVVG